MNLHIELKVDLIKYLMGTVDASLFGFILSNKKKKLKKKLKKILQEIS